MKSHNYTKTESFQAQVDYFSNALAVDSVEMIKSHIFCDIVDEAKTRCRELMQQVKIGKIFIVFS